MRQPTLEENSDYKPQQIDTVETEESRNIHNASTAPFCTDLDQNITPNKTRPPNKEIPEFTAIQLAKFWSQVQIGLSGECWPWTGAKARAPYSKTVFYGNYRGYKVHRIAYAVLVGPIPDGATIDHVRTRGCTNSLCCNPAHLEPISQTEQCARRDEVRLVAPGFTLCKWGHLRPLGKTCTACAKRFQDQNRARKLAGPDAEAYRAKLAANRKRQRAAAKEGATSHPREVTQ